MQVPSAGDKPEWRLNGQTVALTLALTDTVNVLKQRLQDETGMPPAKQKISYDVSIVAVYFSKMLDKTPVLICCFVVCRACSSRTTTR